MKGEPSPCPPGTWNSFSQPSKWIKKGGESIDVDEDVGVMRMEEGQEPRQSLELNRTGTYDSVLVQLLRLLPKDFPSLTSTSFSLLKGLLKGKKDMHHQF